LLLAFGKFVTESAHGDYELGVCRIALYFLSEVANMHVNYPVNDGFPILVKMAEELRTGKNTAWRAHQGAKKFIFRTG
jgi:hypothetical protein